MKLTINQNEEEFKINSDLQVEGIAPIEVFEAVENLKDNPVQVNKLLYLFFELQNDESLTLKPDQELQELIDEAENFEIDEEPLIY